MPIDYLPGATIVDLSHFNPVTETDIQTAVAAGLVGTVIKFTQGLTRVDPLARTLMWEAYDAGAPLLGAYHFGTSEDPAAQARFFLAQVNDDFDGDLSGRELMLDLEIHPSGPAATMSPAQAAVFARAVYDAVGRWPLVYAGRFGPYNDGKGLPEPGLAACDLVLAGYGAYDELAPHLPPGWRPAAGDADRGGIARFWQYTNGEVNGAPFPGLGVVDQWRALGFSSLDALKARWGS